MTTSAYIITTRYVGGRHFIFALDEESRPITLCVVKHLTYLYVGSKKEHNCSDRALQGEVGAIDDALEGAGITVVKHELLRLNEAEHYNSLSLHHHKIYVEGYDMLLKVKDILLKKPNLYQVKEFPNAEAKLFSDFKMRPCQWIEFDDEDIMRCDFGNSESLRRPFQCVIKAADIRPCECSAQPPRALIMSFDIETYSSRHGVRGSIAMPNGAIEADIIYCLSMVFTWSDTNEVLKSKCLCVHQHDIRLPMKDQCEMISVPDENALLQSFAETFNQEDPDCIIGHNIFGYDFGYIQARTTENKLPSYGRLRPCIREVQLGGETHVINIDITEKEKYVEKEWEGAGGLWHSYRFPQCFGRTLMDTLQLVKGTKTSPGTPGTLQSHKLNDVGKFFVGEEKEDMPYEETFRLYRSGDTAGIGRICSYCIQDSALSMKVFFAVKGWVWIREASSVFFQDTTEVMVTGQTQKLYTKFLGKCEQLGFAFSPINQLDDSKLAGGFVGIPKKGRHADVLTLDFGAMYPNIDIRYNFCSSTYSKIIPPGYTTDDFWTFEIPVEKDIQELPAEYDVDDVEDFDPLLVNDEKYLKDVAVSNGVPPDYQATYMEMLRRTYGGVSKGRMEILLVRFIKAPPKDVHEEEELDRTILENEAEREKARLFPDYKPQLKELSTSRKGRKGVLPAMLEEMLAARNAVKHQMKQVKKLIAKAKADGNEVLARSLTIDYEVLDQRQNVIKVGANSAYGCLGAMRGRMSFRPAAAAITFCGRMLIEKVNQFVKEKGCEIIYNDTDSVMLCLPPRLANIPDDEQLKYAYSSGRQMGDPADSRVVELGNQLCDEINTVVLHKPLYVEFERAADMLPLMPKRYMGIQTWPERKNFAKGVVAVRGDTTPFVRTLYTDIVGKILDNHSFEEVHRECIKKLQDLLEGRVPNEMLSVSKMLANSYISSSAPMKVYSDYLTSIGEVAEAGTKLPLVVVKSNASAKKLSKSHRYRLPTTTEPIDYEHYHELAVRPLLQLFNAAFPDRVNEFKL